VLTRCCACGYDANKVVGEPKRWMKLNGGHVAANTAFVLPFIGVSLFHVAA